jgi:hypothetical protein
MPPRRDVEGSVSGLAAPALMGWVLVKTPFRVASTNGTQLAPGLAATFRLASGAEFGSPEDSSVASTQLMTPSESLLLLLRLVDNAVRNRGRYSHPQQLTLELETLQECGVPVLVRRFALDIDHLASTVHRTGWVAGSPGDRETRAEVRNLVRKYKLPPTHPICLAVLAYVRACY